MSSSTPIVHSVAAVTRPPLTRGARETLLAAGVVAASLGVGFAGQLVLPPERLTILAVTGGWAAVVLAATAFRPLRLREVVGSFRFAGVLLTVIAAAVIIGTVIPQEKDAAVYAERYGAAAPALIAGGVTTLFHSLWFATLLGALAAGLIISAARRWPPNVRTLGFFLCHVGLLAILAGSAASFALATRGRVDLRVGAPPATQASITRGSARTGETADLGFAVRLDGFKVETYGTEHRLAVYQLLPDGDAKQLAVLDEDVGVTHRLPDGARYRVKGTEQHAAADVHVIAEEGGAEQEVEIGSEIQLTGGALLRVVAFYPSFSFDLETRQAVSVSDAPQNPALEVLITEAGQEPRRQFLIMSTPGAAHGGGRAGLAYTFHAAEGDGEPAAVVELTDERGTREAVLHPAGHDAVFFGDRKVLTFERRPDEAKAYRSSITVLENGGERPLSVAVNAPVSVAGWSLYQASFDPRDPTYSGLEAVRDPGLPIVFAGFLLLGVGVPLMVNVAPWLRRRNARAIGGRS